MPDRKESPSQAEPVVAEGTTKRRVAMLIYPGVAPLDVAGPLEVFGVANFLRQDELYEVTTVAPSADPVPTRLGMALLPACAMADLALPVDTLLVSGGGEPEAATRPDVVAWLRRAAPRARRFGSICTGTFALGAAGLISGKRVVTHWAFSAELARCNPDAIVEIDPIFVRDGHLCSSAGITAGIDLALALVEEDHGRDFALAVARFLVLFLKRSGGQAQFSTHLQAQFSDVSAVRRVQSWCLDNLEGELSVTAMAKIAGMSARNFSRVFHDETGHAPGAFVTCARVQAACRLLEDSRMTLKVVAQRCGFGSAAALRRAFVRQVGVPPLHYREKFQSSETIQTFCAKSSVNPAKAKAGRCSGDEIS